MAVTSGSNKKRGREGGTVGGGQVWSSDDHARRNERRLLSKQRKSNQNDTNNNNNETTTSTNTTTTTSGTTDESNIKNQTTTTTTNHYTNKLQKQMDRTKLLTHNTIEKKQIQRCKLHRTHIQRKVNELRERLQKYDPLIEKEIYIIKKREEEELKRKQEEELDHLYEPMIPKKKKGRLGPESWKLKGAARPAHEVYDFDVRYVDPYMKQHEDAKNKFNRQINVLTVYKGQASTIITQYQQYIQQQQQELDEVDEEKVVDVDVEQQHVIAALLREYLVGLMEIGYLSYELKQYKICRCVWLECMGLEGGSGSNSNSNSIDQNPTTITTTTMIEPVTSARDAIMKLYLELKKYDAILRLYYDYQLQSDTSTIVQYSVTYAVYMLYTQKQQQVQQQNLTSSSGNEKRKTKKHISTKEDPTMGELPIEINLETLQQYMKKAIETNIFCAYYIAYYIDTFQMVMEYTNEKYDEEKNDLHDENDDDYVESTFDEALFYCNYKNGLYAKMWNHHHHQQQQKNHTTTTSPTRTAAQYLQEMLRHYSSRIPKNDNNNNHLENKNNNNNNNNNTHFLEWDDRLTKIVQEYENRQRTINSSNNDDESGNDLDDDDGDDNDNTNDDDNRNQNKKQKKMMSDEDDNDDNDGPVEEDDDEESNRLELPMFANMFRTGMEMLQEAGLLS